MACQRKYVPAEAADAPALASPALADVSGWRLSGQPVQRASYRAAGLPRPSGRKGFPLAARLFRLKLSFASVGKLGSFRGSNDGVFPFPRNVIGL